jgi:acylphosphatase
LPCRQRDCSSEGVASALTCNASTVRRRVPARVGEAGRVVAVDPRRDAEWCWPSDADSCSTPDARAIRNPRARLLLQPHRPRRRTSTRRALRSNIDSEALRGEPTAESDDRRVDGPAARRICMSGEVSDIALRENVRALAHRLGVLGWVRPMDDGSLSLRAEGEPAALNELVATLRSNPVIETVTDQTVRVEGHEQFAIRGIPRGGSSSGSAGAGGAGSNFSSRSARRCVRGRSRRGRRWTRASSSVRARTRTSALRPSSEGSCLQPDPCCSTTQINGRVTEKCVTRPFPRQTGAQEKPALCRRFL